MGRTASLHLVSLGNCLVNLPLSITGPLSQRGVVSFPFPAITLNRTLTLSLGGFQAPQSIAVQLTVKGGNGQSIVAGWTGLASAVASESLSNTFGQQRSHGTGLGGDKVEIDRQFVDMFGGGIGEGTLVSFLLLPKLSSRERCGVQQSS
jgi:peroxin-1